jgi:hypothetical protein
VQDGALSTGRGWIRRTAPASLACAALVSLAGCGGCDSVPADALTSCQQAAIIPAKVETDILFVVDDSGSMAAEQSLLATAFTDFITRLSSTPVQNDFQIGVTTTSVDWPICDSTLDASGDCPGTFTLRTTYGSGAPYAAGALVAASGHPAIMQAGSPTLVADFTANVAVGIAGSSKEQGLRAMRLALERRIQDGTNAGFLRPGARLAVILVSDEDDCSDLASPPALVWGPSQDRCHSDADEALLSPVQDFVGFLGGAIGGQMRQVTVAVVASVDAVTKQPVMPACNPNGYQGKRYKQFVDAFGTSGFIDDVCQPDFTPTLASIAALLDPGQTMPLSGAPPDWRLLQVQVTRAGGAQLSCAVGLPGTAGADAIYQAPQSGRPPSLTFQGGCLLQPGDAVQVRITCAG